jgi:hypothetical protein
MSDPKDRDPGSKTQPPAPADDSNRSGRPGIDERGNTVWEWKLETGVYSRDISTQRLKKLDLGDLSIAETASHQRPAVPGNDKSPLQKKLPGGGMNPYDSSSSGGGGSPYDNARSFGKKMQPAPPGAPPVRKPMDLKRLEEWMQIRKRLEEQKKSEEDDD